MKKGDIVQIQITRPEVRQLNGMRGEVVGRIGKGRHKDVLVAYDSTGAAVQVKNTDVIFIRPARASNS